MRNNYAISHDYNKCNGGIAMKKTYETPVAKRVEFRFEDQVLAASGYEGGQYNYDNSGKCYQAVPNCNTYPFSLRNLQQ